MHTELLIIGQGIAGTMLSHALEQAGRYAMVIDDGNTRNASNIAGAIINPASGKNWTPARHQGLWVPGALAAYQLIGARLGIQVLHQVQLTITHADAAQQELFTNRVTEQAPFLELCNDHPEQFLNGPYGFGCIQPVYRVSATPLLLGWRHYLAQSGRLIEDAFNAAECQISNDGVRYRDITADKIIFCEGAAGKHNPFFPKQPFTANRGEALRLSIPGLPDDAVYQGPLRLIPSDDGLFWCGSNYRWTFDDLLPDATWRAEATGLLRQWLRLPFTVTDHIVAERPTTAGQVPLSLRHPEYPHVYFFNGLGTRGFSAAPYLAAQLAQQICS